MRGPHSRVSVGPRWAASTVSLVALAIGSAVLISPAVPAPAAQAAFAGAQGSTHGTDPTGGRSGPVQPAVVASGPVLGSLGPVGAGMNGPVYSLAIDPQDDTLYAGGNFTQAGGSAASKVAAWNGSTWTDLGSGTDDIVRALVIDPQNDSLYAGGDFTQAGGSAADYVAAWNGSAWSSLGSGMDGSVWALAISAQDDTLYAGGNFTQAGGSAANYMAAWNGSTWSSLGSGVNGSVWALAMGPGDAGLYAGGTFDDTGGGPVNPCIASGGLDCIAKWNGNAWSGIGSGMNGQVSTLVIDPQDDTIYTGGAFIPAAGFTPTGVAAWTGYTWSPLGAGVTSTFSFWSVKSLASDDSRGLLYAGGYFNRAGNNESNSIAVWDAGISSWIPLTWLADGSNGVGAGDEVQSLALDDSTVYLGGNFTDAGNNPLGDNIVKWTWDEPSGSLSDTSGDLGTLIGIEGWGLIGVTGVTFNGTAAASYTRDDSTTISNIVVPSTPGTYTVRVKAVGSASAAGTVVGTFTVNGSVPPPPPSPSYPPSPPGGVTAVAGDGEATVSWEPSASPGDFPVTNYEARSGPGGANCLVTAPTTSCTITGLSNGRAYSFEVRALNGAGWGSWSGASSPVTPTPSATKSILITGSRASVKDRPGVKATGTTVGLAGTIVQARVHVAGEVDCFDGAVRTVAPDGSFAWQRKTGKKVYVYFRSLADPGVRSNRVVILAA
jgi:hypothetical protein